MDSVSAKILLLVSVCFLMFVAGGSITVKAKTMCQTNINEYDPRIDIRTNTVIVHEYGKHKDVVYRAISDWKETGQNVYLMWYVGTDTNRKYIDGKIDGKQHYDEIEVDSRGKEFWVGSVRPYMVPTGTWIQYMEDIARMAVEIGVEGVSPEEPLAHTGAGYSPAFKEEWQEFYGEEWSSPSSSINSFWKASKLKSHLYLCCIESVAKAMKEHARERGSDVEFILPIHSLISHAAGSMIYPNGETFHLDEVDGFIGQVWTGPVGWSLPRYEGRQFTRDRGFFESAWILYSSFANLVRQSEKRMYLLADPVEDDPSYKWEEYHIWYDQCLVSKLMFPWVSDYEVMPWPDRIFLPGFGTGGGSPGPAKFLTQLMVNVAVLDDMENQDGVLWDCGTEGTGVLVGDTLAWQRGGPSSSSMDSLNGLVVPLLRKGIPVQIVPIERSVDEGYLDDFSLLLLSSDIPLLDEVTIAAETSALLFDASSLMQSVEPVVLYGSHEVIDSINRGNQTLLLSAGPLQTRGVVRIFAGSGHSENSAPLGVEAFVIGDVDNELYSVGHRRSGEDVMRFPASTLLEIWPRWRDSEVDYDKILEQARAGQLREADIEWKWDEVNNTLLVDFEQWHSGVLITAKW